VSRNPVELTRIVKKNPTEETVKYRLEAKHRARQGAEQLVVDATSSNLSRRDAVAGVRRAWGNLKGAFKFVRVIGRGYDLTFWKKPPRI